MPVWLAAMMHVPALTPVTVLPLVPLTVQTPVVVEVKVTGLPLAPPVADTVPLLPTLIVGAAPKVIVCAPLPTGMLRVT